MGVICFSSLKGGVGNTTLSLKVAAAYAERGGETLLIDLDPTAHTTRFFMRGEQLPESPLARLFLSNSVSQNESLIDVSVQKKINLLREVRKRLVLLPAGAELRHFLWGKGAHTFKHLFSKLIRELRPSFDYIVIDTPPDFSIIVRNALATSDLVVVPVDGSAMSIDCLNQLISDASHIKGPQWCIVRSMVSKQASRLRKISENRIKENLSVKEFAEDEDFEEALDETLDGQNEFTKSSDNFISFVSDTENISSTSEPVQNENPIYLLDSMVYRTEEQNKLSFSSKTAFETKKTSSLALQYKTLARELDALLMVTEEKKSGEIEGSDSVFDFSLLSGERMESVVR
jgi:chromosome partitioning protein